MMPRRAQHPRRSAYALLVVLLAACSAGAPVPVSTPTSTSAVEARPVIAFITHQAPGDEFWDVVRRGAQAAADKNGVELRYQHDNDAGRQAELLTAATADHVAGIAVSLPAPPILAPAVRAAVAAGIPVVALNTGVDDWQALGMFAYFGQDDAVAGRAVGERLSLERAANVLCVLQENNHIGLEARCNSAAANFTGQLQKLYVDGTDRRSAQAAIAAKVQQDRGIDRVLTLSAAIALVAQRAIGDANSYARVVTFDTNSAVIEAISRGTVKWAVDQQPYLQGYLAVDALWLRVASGNVIGGGRPTLTGPTFIDESNVEGIVGHARAGTR
jgi:simple sugar transport system substrate-binding protein